MNLKTTASGVALAALGYLAATFLPGIGGESASVDPVQARAEADIAHCDLSATARALFREQLDAKLDGTGICDRRACGGEELSRCPGTPLAEALELPMGEIVEREKLRQEVEEAVRDTVKAEAAEAEAAKE